MFIVIEMEMDSSVVNPSATQLNLLVAVSLKLVSLFGGDFNPVLKLVLLTPSYPVAL